MATNDVAAMLEEISLYLKAEGNTREAQSYSKAADTVRRRDHIPANPKEMDGVGDVLRDIITEYQHRGHSSKLADLRAKHPYLDELTSVHGIGPKTARRIYEALGVETVDELRERSDELTDVYGIGEKTAKNIRDEL